MQVFPVLVGKLCPFIIFLLVSFPSFLLPFFLHLFVYFTFCFVKLFMQDLSNKCSHVGKCISFSHTWSKKCFWAEIICLSLILLFFHTLYVTLPLKIPVFFTEKQIHVSVGENGEERGLWRGRKMWVVVREVKISKPSKTLSTKTFSVYYMNKGEKRD